MNITGTREQKIEFIENQLLLNPILNFKWIGEGTDQDNLISSKQKCIVYPAEDIRTRKLIGAKVVTPNEKLVLDRDDYYEDGDNFELMDGAELDTSTKSGKVTWDWLKHSVYLALSKEEASLKSDRPHFYVYIEEVEATKSISKIQDKLKALNLVENSSVDDLYMRVRLMGENRSGQNPVLIREYLLDIADRNPQQILDLYTSSTTVAKLALYEYQDNNIVRIDNNGIYYYQEEMLGSLDQAVNYIAKNGKPSIIKAMQTKLRDIKSKEILQAEKQK